MKRYCLFAALLCLAQTVSPNLLYDITEGKFRPKTLPAFHSMNDGEHYTVLADSATIVRYAYRTGQATDTVLCLGRLADAPIRRMDGYVFSPNEELLLVYTNMEYRYRRTFTADYYLYDIRKGELRLLSEYGRLEAPAFSPDSRYVAFVRENNIYLRKLDFDTELAVTRDGRAGSIINGVPDWVYEEEFGATRYFEWSPDSKMIAFLKFDESDVPEFSFQLYNRHPDEDGLTLYPESLRFKYPKAGQANSKVRVFVYDDYNKNTREIKPGDTEGDYYIPRIRWTKSAEQLAIFKLNRNQNRLDMYLANPKSTVATLTLSEEDPYYIDYGLIDDLYFMDDNKSFLYVSERDGYRHVYRYRMNGLLDKQLTSGPWDVTAVYGYDEKTGTLYYQAAEASPMQRNVYALDAKGRTTRLTDGRGMHQATFNSTFTNFIDNGSTTATPNRMALRTNKGKELRVLEDNAALASTVQELDLPRKEFFQFTTSEGVTLNGWMVRPADFDTAARHPLLLVQYSGPDSQEVLDSWSIGWEYYLAQQGYVVACVDGRGTGARGAEFRKCTYRRLGTLEVRDQIEAARYLGMQPGIDPQRIGIWGWSYGGFMTLMCMSAPDSPFKAGIAVAPVTDWRLYDAAYTERFMRRPQENFTGYDAASPLLRADSLQGRLLIVHGTADDNVHVQNTMLYVSRLVEAGKQFEMQIYPDKNHSILGKQTRRHLYTRKCDFLFNNL